MALVPGEATTVLIVSHTRARIPGVGAEGGGEAVGVPVTAGAFAFLSTAALGGCAVSVDGKGHVWGGGWHLVVGLDEGRDAIAALGGAETAAGTKVKAWLASGLLPVPHVGLVRLCAPVVVLELHAGRCCAGGAARAAPITDETKLGVHDGAFAQPLGVNHRRFRRFRRHSSIIGWG